MQLSQWSRRKRSSHSSRYSTTASQRCPTRRICRTTQSREASSASRCWSSQAPVQVVQRPAMPALSHSCSETECTSPTQQVVLQSGAARLQHPRTAPTRTVTDRHGATHCSRITQSTVSECSSDRIRSVRIWLSRSRQSPRQTLPSRTLQRLGSTQWQTAKLTRLLQRL